MSGRRHIERQVCAVLQYLLCHCACRRQKTTLHGSDLLQCCRSGKINDRQFCSHVCVIIKTNIRVTAVWSVKETTGRKNDRHKNAICVRSLTVLKRL